MNAVGKVTNGKFEEFANTRKGGSQDLSELAGRVATAEREITEIKDTAQNQGEELAKKVDSDGDISNTVVTFEQATTLANVNSGDSMSVALGKLAKLYEELDGKAAYYPVTTEFPVSEVGKMMDAKTVSEKIEANGINIYNELTSEGWYRISSCSNGEISGGFGDTGLIMIGRGYNDGQDESFILTYALTFGGRVSWNCLNSLANVKYIDAIRLTRTNGKMNLELHYNSSSTNPVYVKYLPLGTRKYFNEELQKVSESSITISEYLIPNINDISKLRNINYIDFESYNGIPNITLDSAVMDILTTRIPLSRDDTIIGRFEYSGQYRIVIQTYTNKNYNSAIVFGYGTPYPIYYRTLNGEIVRFNTSGETVKIGNVN